MKEENNINLDECIRAYLKSLGCKIREEVGLICVRTRDDQCWYFTVPQRVSERNKHVLDIIDFPSN
jgi:hypothetical protein